MALPQPTSNSWLAAAEFAATVRQQAGQHRGLCALDLTVENVADFEYGKWALAERDLRELTASGALPAHVAATLRRVCASHRAAAAFDLRVELVNYKKVVLHLFNEGGVIEKDLRQLTALLHCPLTPGSAPPDAQRAYTSLASAVMDAKGSRTAMQDARVFTKTICTIWRHPASRKKSRLDGLPGTLVVHKRAVSFLHWVRRQRERHAGVAVSAAAQPDVAAAGAKDSAAAATEGGAAAAAAAAEDPTVVEVCEEPGMRGTVLRRIRANAQVDFSQSGGPASRWLMWTKLEIVSGPFGAFAEPEPEPEPEAEPQAEADATSWADLEGSRASSWSALCVDLRAAGDAAGWPQYVTRYLLQMLMVRGACKALLMADALRVYVNALATVPAMLEEAEVALVEIRGGKDDDGTDDGAGEAGLGVDDSGSCGVKAAVAARRQLQLLRGLHAATADNAHWTAVLLARFDATELTENAPRCGAHQSHNLPGRLVPLNHIVVGIACLEL